MVFVTNSLQCTSIDWTRGIFLVQCNTIECTLIMKGCLSFATCGWGRLTIGKKVDILVLRTAANTRPRTWPTMSTMRSRSLSGHFANKIWPHVCELAKEKFAHVQSRLKTALISEVLISETHYNCTGSTLVNERFWLWYCHDNAL